MTESKFQFNNSSNDEPDDKLAETEFFKQMDIAEESIKTEGTITSEELRASLGI